MTETVAETRARRIAEETQLVEDLTTDIAGMIKEMYRKQVEIDLAIERIMKMRQDARTEEVFG